MELNSNAYISMFQAKVSNRFIKNMVAPDSPNRNARKVSQK